MIRAFFGIPIPTFISKVLFSLLEKNQHLPVIFRAVHELHITVQFIKAIDPVDIPKLLQNTRLQLQLIRPFEIILTTFEFFPSHQNPRFLSMGMQANDTLMLLAKEVGQAILNTHYTIEHRLYRPHLTLGKFKGFPPIFLLENMPDVLPNHFLVDEVIFYQSNPSREGSQYTVLDRISLKI